MNLFRGIWGFVHRDIFGSKPRAWWNLFTVAFNEKEVLIREAHWWSKRIDEGRFQWKRVQRVCFKDCGLSSDMLLIYTSERDEPFMVPMEADGGDAFWTALRERNLFPEEVARAAVQSTDGRWYCWPPGATPTREPNKS